MKSLKEILYDNISNSGTSIDTLFYVIENLHHKQETGTRKLRELAREKRIEAKKKDSNGREYWEIIHDRFNNHTVIAYRRKVIDKIPEKVKGGEKILTIQQLFRTTALL